MAHRLSFATVCGISLDQDQTHVTYTGRCILGQWASKEALQWLLNALGENTIIWENNFNDGGTLWSLKGILGASVQFSCSVVSDSLWPHESQHARPPCPSPTPGVHPNPCPSSQWCHPTISASVVPFSSCPQSFPASGKGWCAVSNETALCITWPKYWSFSFNISPSNEHPGLISFRMDWLDLLSVQGTLKSLLRHHSSKASILRCSAFFIIQLSHPYMTTGKNIALTRQTCVDKGLGARVFKAYLMNPQIYLHVHLLYSFITHYGHPLALSRVDLHTNRKISSSFCWVFCIIYSLILKSQRHDKTCLQIDHQKNICLFYESWNRKGEYCFAQSQLRGDRHIGQQHIICSSTTSKSHKQTSLLVQWIRISLPNAGDMG